MVAVASSGQGLSQTQRDSRGGQILPGRETGGQVWCPRRGLKTRIAILSDKTVIALERSIGCDRALPAYRRWTLHSRCCLLRPQLFIATTKLIDWMGASNKAT